MAKWYRALVVFMAAAMTMGTAWLAYAGFELWQAGQSQKMVWADDCFQWTNGLYDVNGQLNGGILEELTVRRVQAALDSLP